MFGALISALAKTFGMKITEKLLQELGTKKNGTQKLTEATEALEQGISAIEALKRSFGKDFFPTLNHVLESFSSAPFRYEAGTSGYFKVDENNQLSTDTLRDELNINLDRLATLDIKNADLKNHFNGVMRIWQNRCRSAFLEKDVNDIEQSFEAINKILNGDTKNFRQVYELLSKTALGGVGALLVISGVLTAAGVGVGLVSAISLFLFGIPWMTVGALVLPGALLILLAARKTNPIDELSLSVSLAYRLLDRLHAKDQ